MWARPSRSKTSGLPGAWLVPLPGGRPLRAGDVMPDRTIGPKGPDVDSDEDEHHGNFRTDQHEGSLPRHG